MLLEEIARTSADVADSASRLAKVERLAATLRRLRPEEVPAAVLYLSGVLPGGTIGVGWASLRDLPPPAAPPPALELLEVHASLDRIRLTTGRGSQAARRALLADLFSRATEPERRFLIGLLLGDLRQGALEGLMVEAVARAAGVPPSQVRRAVMLAGDLGAVAAAAIADGLVGLARFRLTVLRPLQPMLAAEWGHGRRRGWLSNLHLGARDPDGGGFVMLGKTFKGMTDRMLAWQTERLLELENSRDRYTVYVRPELVVEVAFDGVHASPRYPGGLALRFARVKGYRPDKGPSDADAIGTVRAIHAGAPPA